MTIICQEKDTDGDSRLGMKENTQGEDQKEMDEMKRLFEYFEDADEAVCISDADTNELVYLNRVLRNALGYQDPAAYQGIKRCSLLENFNIPCEYDQREALPSEGFTTWVHDDTECERQYIIKDKVMKCCGHRYRVETAREKSQSGLERAELYLSRRESVLNECLQIFFAAPNPEKSLEDVLSYLGDMFRGERVCIFEIYENGTVSNTYEWCAEGVASQIEIFHSIPLSDIHYLTENFAQKDSLVIHDIEDIHQEHPRTYSLLKPRGIHGLAAGRIEENGELKGFISVDNPKKSNIFLLEQVLRELGKYMMPQLRRRDLYRRFNQMSYHDMLTGAYNHNAIMEHMAVEGEWKSFGAVCCDINALKETNNTQGHEAGDEAIRECYRMMQRSLHTEWIYRIGGDEFVALYYDIDSHIIEKDMDELRLAVLQSTCQVSIGSAWSDEAPIDVEKVMDRADAEMNREKNLYYALMEIDKSEAQHASEEVTGGADDEDARQVVLRRFLSNAYCDVAFLLSVMSDENKTSYFFFGDMQQSVYYISENMRVKFGFSSNVISDFIHVWASRIEDPELLQHFWGDLDAVLNKKQKYHDLRYQVFDANGNKIWIHWHGQVKWSEDGTTPLFFAGRISQQDEDFVVDPLTNFPAEAVLVRELEKLENTKGYHQMIGFSLHNISQINNNFGRDYGDELICKITKKLSDSLSREMTFYRLNGMRFLALLEEHSIERAEEFITQIHDIIDSVYQMMDVTIPITCSFVMLRYPQDGVTSQDFVENALALIKVANQSPDQRFIDDSVANLRKIKETAGMESQLIENVLHGMKNFRIVIQPVVSTETGHPVGGETLLRWQYEGENVSPTVFIPIIERENMIQLVGRWVFEQAVRACTRLRSLKPDIYLTVNVSLQQLKDEGFVSFIEETLEKYQLDGKHIVLELTESCMDSQPEKLEAFVAECTKLNMRIALDDFGSGYSSLRVLLRYPSNIIKLDRSLLVEMSDSSEKSGFITSIVYACHQFGKKVCMEGVETEFQKELVEQAGCDLIQGFYYYKPLELDTIYQLIGGKCSESNVMTEKI